MSAPAELQAALDNLQSLADDYNAKRAAASAAQQAYTDASNALDASRTKFTELLAKFYPPPPS